MMADEVHKKEAKTQKKGGGEGDQRPQDRVFYQI